MMIKDIKNLLKGSKCGKKSRLVSLSKLIKKKNN